MNEIQREPIWIHISDWIILFEMQVKEYLEQVVADLKATWARGIEYTFCVQCPCDPEQRHFLCLDDCLTKGIVPCSKGFRVQTDDIQRYFMDKPCKIGTRQFPLLFALCNHYSRATLFALIFDCRLSLHWFLSCISSFLSFELCKGLN